MLSWSAIIKTVSIELLEAIPLIKIYSDPTIVRSNNLIYTIILTATRESNEPKPPELTAIGLSDVIKLPVRLFIGLLLL